MNDIQTKQGELDNYILDKKGLKIIAEDDKIYTKRELRKNILLALYDELNECVDAPNDSEEYIDVLHFVLSLSNLYGIKLAIKPNYKIGAGKNLTELLSDMLKSYSKIVRCGKEFKHWSNKKPTALDYVNIHVELQMMIYNLYAVFNIIDKDLIEEYNVKYQINIERQNSNY